MLSGAQLGITVTALLVGFIAGPPWPRWPPVGCAAGLPGRAPAGHRRGSGAAIATVVQMVLGELAPKNLGIARPEPVAKFPLPARPCVYLEIAGPVIRLFDSAATGLLRRVGVEPHRGDRARRQPRGAVRIISESARAGDLPPRLSELLERALEFGDRTAEDVMVPRPRLVLLGTDARSPT